MQNVAEQYNQEDVIDIINKAHLKYKDLETQTKEAKADRDEKIKPLKTLAAGNQPASTVFVGNDADMTVSPTNAVEVSFTPHRLLAILVKLAEERVLERFGSEEEIEDEELDTTEMEKEREIVRDVVKTLHEEMDNALGFFLVYFKMPISMGIKEYGSFIAKKLETRVNSFGPKLKEMVKDGVESFVKAQRVTFKQKGQ